MRKFIAIGIVLLLAIGLIVDRGLESEPAITADAASAVEAPSQLADLGPVTLITNEYLAGLTAACVPFGAGSIYFLSFSAAGLGSTGVVTSASGSSGTGTISAQVGGGIASVLGTTTLACGSGLVATVVGGIDSGAHDYVLSISI